jgi:phage terminase small subunit
MQEAIPDKPAEVVKAAMGDRDELKLFTRDKQKELKILRDLLQDLNPFQIRFVEAYIKTASASQAAKMAGSNSKTPETVGYKTLQDARVQSAIAIGFKMRIEAVGLDTTEVIVKLRKVYDMAIEAGKFADANKACELLQKEIERANKAPQMTSQGKLVSKMETDGENIDHELNKVVELLQGVSA